jgi:DNA-binding NtrC family response regulator
MLLDDASVGSALAGKVRQATMGRILIVDDEPHMRRILISNLKQEGHDLTEAAGLHEARQALGEREFEAVITDQKMGDGGDWTF